MRELVLLVLVALSVPLVLKRPLWGITIYLGANIIRPEMFFWGGNSGSYVFKVYYVLIFAGIILQNYVSRISLLAKREFFLIVWLFGAILLSSALTQYPIFRGYYHLFELLKGFGICALLYVLITSFEEIEALQKVMLGCFAFLAIWGVDQQLRGNERLEGLGGGSWADSNGIAAMYILFLPVALSRVLASKKRKEFWLSICMVLLIFTLIVCTKSRAGLLGLITCLLMFGFYSRNLIRIGLISLVLMLGAAPFVTQSYVDRMNTMKGVSGIKDSARDRITLWKAGLLIFSDNPLIGTGFLTFPEAKMKYESYFLELDDEFRKSVFRPEKKRVTHNTYIQLLADCGILGALPFILLVGGGILTGFRARRLLRIIPAKQNELLWLCGLSAGIAGYAVCIMSIDSLLNMLFYNQIVFASILYRKILETGAEATAEQVPVDGNLAANGNI